MLLIRKQLPRCRQSCYTDGAYLLGAFMELWQQLVAVAARAQQNGDLVSIPNEFEVVHDHEIPFVIRYAPQLVDKIRATKKPSQRNPFLPPEPNLCVSAIGSEHQLVLNKFNVLEHHGLLITNEFIEQTDQLRLSDFQAVEMLLRTKDSLVFYNGGKNAGASQPHRHFQWVPRDFGAGELPVQVAIDACRHHECAQIFPFEHRLFWLPDYRGETLWDAWLKLEYAWRSYNLLVTREWMLVVPRSAESVDGISMNCLAFAGGLLATNAEQFEWIKTQGPINLLQQVCEPPS